MKTFKFGKHRVQITWLEIGYRKRYNGSLKEFYITAATVFRLMWGAGAFLIGFSILGFGIGYDWEK